MPAQQAIESVVAPKTLLVKAGRVVWVMKGKEWPHGHLAIAIQAAFVVARLNSAMAMPEESGTEELQII
jgi:hypothetical protein